MPTITNLTHDELRAMDGSELLAQQICQYGAIHALEHLLAKGASRENAESMLADLQYSIGVIEEAAEEKGVALNFEEEPVSMTTKNAASDRSAGGEGE